MSGGDFDKCMCDSAHALICVYYNAMKKTLFRVKEALTHAAEQDERDARRRKLLVKRHELFRYSPLFIAHLSTMQKTLIKYGFSACTKHVRAKPNRRDRSHAHRCIDIAESRRDAQESMPKIILDYSVESHLDGALGDRNRANRHPRFALALSLAAIATASNDLKSDCGAPTRVDSDP